MKYVIGCLKQERENLLAMIKGGDSDKVKNKVEVEQAIKWLEKLDQLQFPEIGKCKFIELPFPEDYFMSYRIMNDHESNDPKDWTELEKDDNGKPICLLSGDYLVNIR